MSEKELEKMRMVLKVKKFFVIMWAVIEYICNAIFNLVAALIIICLILAVLALAFQLQDTSMVILGLPQMNLMP